MLLQIMLTGKFLMPLLAITFRFSLPARLFRSPPRKKSGRGNFRKANWDGFTQELENLCSDLPKHNDAKKTHSIFSPAAFKKQLNTISLEGNEETTGSRFGKITISKI
ncbi:hypothetical protein TNCV_1729901 [Trichonephila clavipes]|nr:hypothetical protein TNCV_1729901 [Trichonephila clavipes]